MIYKFFAFIILLFLPQTNLLGYSILPETIHSQKHYLKSTQEITLTSTPAIRAFITQNIPITNNITLEAYYTFKKPQNIKNPMTGSNRLFIINILHSISSMQGIKYYSQTRKRLRILFDKSYIVQYPSLKPLHDPCINKLIDEYSFYAMQKDTTFGEVIYQYTIYQKPEFILLKSENMDVMKYFMMPIVDKKGFKFFLFILVNGEDIALYCLYSIEVINDKVFPLQKVRDSLFNRSDAIVLWFYNRLFGK
ncbi:MAG TPA: hypothetical protein PLO73_00570 [Spirochaetota bacterium]|nr:hypothetical protein [Spirochaetota bacterium]HPP48446.1 hypothetical protein [Spirochaetota bacterium]HXK64718.1 hypothetical protein [Spirochaetota bacterium]